MESYARERERERSKEDIKHNDQRKKVNDSREAICVISAEEITHRRGNTVTDESFV